MVFSSPERGFTVNRYFLRWLEISHSTVFADIIALMPSNKGFGRK